VVLNLEAFGGIRGERIGLILGVSFRGSLDGLPDSWRSHFPWVTLAGESEAGSLACGWRWKWKRVLGRRGWWALWHGMEGLRCFSVQVSRCPFPSEGVETMKKAEDFLTIGPFSPLSPNSKLSRKKKKTPNSRGEAEELRHRQGLSLQPTNKLTN